MNTRTNYLGVCCALSLIASCTTVRLTPSASRYLKNGGSAKTAQEDLDKAARDLTLARSSAERVLRLLDQFPKLKSWLGTSLGVSTASPTVDQLAGSREIAASATPTGATKAETDPATLRAELAQQVVELWWVGAFVGIDKDNDKAIDVAFERIFDGKKRPLNGSPEPTPVVPGEMRVRFLRDQVADRALDVQQLQLVESGRWEYFVDGSVYFSIEPMVAIRPELQAVAIPSIAVNWRPFNVADTFGDENSIYKGLSAVGFQLTLGGALNPGGGSQDSTGGAIGCGMSLPVASVGAFSFGAVWYADGNDSHCAPYVSLTLGDFGKSTSGTDSQ